MFLIRRCRLVPLAIAAALSLSACGADGDNGAEDQQLDLADEESAAPTEPSKEPTTEEPADGGSDRDLPDGWTLAEADGFSIGLPPGWFNGHRALNDEEFMAEVASGIENMTDAELAATLEQGITGIDLLAFKTADVGSDFKTNINVIVEPRGPFDELEVIRELAPKEIERAGAMSVEMDVYEVNGMPGVELTYDLPEFGTKGIQNFLLAEDIIVIATYSAVDPDAELWRSVLDTIAVAS